MADVLDRPKTARQEEKERPSRRDHIELPGQDALCDQEGWILVVMYCGYLVKILDDGKLIGEDFYHHNAGHKASCEGCLSAWRSS